MATTSFLLNPKNLKGVLKTEEFVKPTTGSHQAYIEGSDYGYACLDTIQIKGSVCHSKCVDRI